MKKSKLCECCKLLKWRGALYRTFKVCNVCFRKLNYYMKKKDRSYLPQCIKDMFSKLEELENE